MDEMECPNILFVVMDTARAKNSLPSINEEVVPNLAELANSGVEFTSTISNAPWTLPSHASIFTGKHTSNHNTNAGNKNFDPDDPCLPELLNKNGYTTVAFSNNSWISPEFGFDRGFDYFYKGWELIPAGEDLARAMRENDTPANQIRSILTSTEFKHLPSSILNSLFAKFLRKKYDYGAYLTNWKIKRWLNKERNKEDPFFMFINYLEPHLEYNPPNRFCEFLDDDISPSEAKEVNQDAWGYVSGEIEMHEEDFEILEDLYKSEIKYLDHRIGNLLDHLSERGILEETLVVVVGDHGENIGDHNLMDHQYSLYDTLVHVPLVINGPEIFTGGKKISHLVESRDLFPTILETAGAEVPKRDGISQSSLEEAIHEENDDGAYAISEYLVPQPAVDTLRNRAPDSTIVDKYDRALRAIRTTEWKYIVGSDGTKELYNIESDPGELNDVADSNPEVVERLHEKIPDEYGTLERGNSDEEQLDAAAQQRLEDLGYI
ncbi:sulfatase [Haloterrigena sp. SYSU A558-1]|uniref:Sulfatase n=1 Tax=Haloterrigena gelatinilytica TaxID=2741724 RepID=A0ABX2LI32_9EURY|nr:sulfatase [Haloterrigena gelatinilytica]NUC72764.1 sulfatase [Haloterrigena gelatinilytica]